MAPTSKKHNKFIRFCAYPFRRLYKLISPVNYVKAEYRYITGHKLNLDNPERYTEKLQYLRLITYPNDDLVSKCAGRVGLREYAKENGLEDYLIPIYGIYDHFDDINFDELPSAFVMKCTHGCALNYICYDKVKLDIKALRKRFIRYLKLDYGKKTIERHYSKIKPQIIIEKLLLEDNHLPVEYKIHVFNGKARYMYIVTGRDKDIHYNNYYVDWKEFREAQFNHWTETNEPINKPDEWNKMVKIAEKLAKPFPFVRVDLYYVDNKIYISEMTFTPAKGTLTFRSDKADYLIGSWLKIN